MSSPVLTRTPPQTVQAFLDAFARHDIDAAIAVTDPRVSVTVHPLGLHEVGADALREVLADLVRGFPDLVISVSRVCSLSARSIACANAAAASMEPSTATRML